MCYVEYPTHTPTHTYQLLPVPGVETECTFLPPPVVGLPPTTSGVIVLFGSSDSGKSTVAEYLERTRSYKRVPLASFITELGVEDFSDETLAQDLYAMWRAHRPSGVVVIEDCPVAFVRYFKKRTYAHCVWVRRPPMTTDELTEHLLAPTDLIIANDSTLEDLRAQVNRLF